MSSSLYKMAEAGLTSINVNRLPDLMRVFKSSDLLFDRLAKYSAGQSYIDHLMISYKQTPKDSFAELADVDSEFKHLYEKSLVYFDYEEGSIGQKKYVHDELVSEVRLFLQNNKYPIKEEEKFHGVIIKEIMTVPSLNLDILLNIVTSFAKMMPQHYGTIAADWEFENRKLFTSVDGFFNNKKYIIDKKNLSIYTYEFLKNDDFSSVNFIFFSTEGSDKLKNEFVSGLSNSRNNELAVEEKNKINFKSISKKRNETAGLLMHPKDSRIQLDAFWVFTTKNGNKIGFVGVSGEDINTVYNLTYHETLDRVEIFNKLWQNI